MKDYVLIFVGAIFCLEKVRCPPPKLFTCPEVMTFGWMESPPYIYQNNTGEENTDGYTESNEIVGPILKILRQALEISCCRNNITLEFAQKYDEYSDLVSSSVNSTFDMVIPIITKPGKKKYLAFPYVLLVESPGFVLYNFNRKSAQEAIIHTFTESFPLALLLFLLVSIFGVTFWIVDTLPRKSGQKRTVSERFSEIGEAIWWSFVTLSTVGYGDIVPTKISSRVVCYIWMLISSVSIAMFTATVTSILIFQCFSMELEIKGEFIAVINGSREHKLVIKQNGKPVVFRNYQELLSKVEEDRQVQGAVVELYAASYYQESFSKYRIERVYEDIAAVGVVLRTNTVKYRYCLQQHILGYQGEFYEQLRKDLPALKTTIAGSAVEEQSMGILSPSTADLRKLFLTLSGMLIFLCLTGILREKLLLRRKKRKKSRGEDNNALLHTLRINFNKSMNECMTNMIEDMNILQNQIQSVAESIEKRSRGTTQISYYSSNFNSDS